LTAPISAPPITAPRTGRPLTGRKVAMIFIAFFGTVFTVNFYMMYRAISGFPGLVEEHPYIVSQEFDTHRDAQIALGWTTKIDWADGRLTATVTDRDGAPLPGLTVNAIVGRSVTRDQDHDLTLVAVPDAPGVYVVQTVLAPGRWRAEMQILNAGGDVFRAEATIFAEQKS
jgi:nitrogen fixation protein FixH